MSNSNSNSNSSFSWKKFQKAPIVGIIRGLSEETIIKIANSYQDAGLYALEITMNTHKAEELIKKLRSGFPELCIGAGTVCTLIDLNNAIEAGAQFIVTPIINEAVIKKSVALGIPIFPGAYTPSEIYYAWSMGASAVKVFPATQLGPRYIKDVLAPLNEIKLLPTGGVSKENIQAFFEAGAVGAGMGSSILNKALIDKGDYKGLENYFQSIKHEIRNFV